jgi:hypothetical protein
VTIGPALLPRLREMDGILLAYPGDALHILQYAADHGGLSSYINVGRAAASRLIEVLSERAEFDNCSIQGEHDQSEGRRADHVCRKCGCALFLNAYPGAAVEQGYRGIGARRNELGDRPPFRGWWSVFFASHGLPHTACACYSDSS